MKTVVLNFSCLCLLLKCFTAQAVIQSGIVTWTHDGAHSYSLWKQPPASTNKQFIAATTNNSIALTSPLPDGWSLWLRGNYYVTNTICCLEGEYGFVVTPPGNYTNVTIRIERGGFGGYAIQGSIGPGYPFHTIGIYNGKPVQITADFGERQMFRLMLIGSTNLPPMPGGKP